MRDSSDSPTPAPDPLIGRQIRDLRIVERIGQGGMGAVYKAEHVLLHEPRALKVMRTELFESVPNAVERFEREARIAVKLRHPNLVLLYDFFVEADHHYLVMEYVVGTSLAAFLREHGALSVEGTCRIGIQCCAGLSHAHEMGIIHRDLSPENVMLATTDAGLSVKIIDFGVARAAFGGRGSSLIRAADKTLTGANEFIGKPRYASPEQAGALRKGETIDHRSDLYTLGLILYEMATGRPPFHADSPLDYLSQHAHEPPPLPSEIAPDLGIPSALERVILRCLEKDREQRYANARELSAALEWAWRASGTEPPRRAPGRASEAPVPAIPRSRRVAPLAAGTALAVLAAGAGGLWWSTRAGEEPASREQPAPPLPAPVAPSEPLAANEPIAVEVSPEPAPVDPFVTPEPELAPQPEPAPPIAVAPEPAVAPAPKPEAKPEPRPEPKPERPAPAAPKPAPAKPSAVAFANEREMKRAFDAALEFEKSHPASAAIANWKEFRGRSPSQELDEQAKRRITALTLGNLPGL
jgi:eukaryotic-like serine/threonine-protein kinase